MYRLSAFILFLLIVCIPAYAEGKNPVTYHLTFDNLGTIQSLLAEDWIEQTGLKTIEDRKWDLIEGQFGRALYLGAVPLKYDVDNMSGLDLDMVTAVIFNVAYSGSKGRGYDEPFMWGAGKLHPALGAVAFWVKGSSKPQDEDARTILFEQTTTTWGRKERQLIEVELFRDRTISAYVEDARYFQHTVKTGPVWNDNDWNHVVFMWDRSSGVSLWVNGIESASSMGTDAWWENQRPGLFHIPMSLAAYDEFYLFSRTLSDAEISNLYKNNTPPAGTDQKYRPSPDGINRLKAAYISDTSRLPVAKTLPGDKTLVFTEITPVRIHDEGISGWWISDGRYELAWPHEYSVFTIIPGDVDFHAEKADLLPPEGVNINYITIEGNLDDVSVMKGDRNGNFSSKPLFSTSKTDAFFHGAYFSGIGDSELRIPFTKGYGAPPGFETDNDALQLPLSGDLRLHEAGLFNVEERDVPLQPGDKTLYMGFPVEQLNDSRYEPALIALKPGMLDSYLALSSIKPITQQKGNIGLVPMMPVSFISEPSVGKIAYKTIILDLIIRSHAKQNVLTVRFFNPAVPSQTWTHAEVQLDGFTGKTDRLRLALDFTPVFLADGDRIWIELMATDELTIDLIDNEYPATVTLRPETNWAEAEQPYAKKAMIPAIMTFGRSFEYIPWMWDKRMPDVDAPVNFGGQFDMAYPWQAVLKLFPGNETANIYRAYTDLLDPDLPPRQSVAYPQGRYPADMSTLPEKQYSAPRNAPEWAVYFREFQTFRNKIVTWWRQHQRSDGQVGGGWNDDTLIFSRAFGDMPLDSNPDALTLYNKAFNGFDTTNYFKDGYCRIHPIDRLHNGDFVRERYKSFIYNLGDPRSAVWAMEEAWHWGKPDKTPINYGDGRAFLFGKDVLEWYWGKRSAERPYRLANLPQMTGELRKSAAAANDTTLWRYTEAWCHTDDQSPYGVDNLLDVLLGGWGYNPRKNDSNVAITVGVGWIEGGGPDMGRLVEYSGSDGLEICLYSFMAHEKTVTMRCYRLDPGTYTVSLKADKDGNGSYETTLSDSQRTFNRFDRFSFVMPPQVPVHLDVKQVSKAPDQGNLADLAVSSFYVEQSGSNAVVTAHNIGCAPSGAFEVSLVVDDVVVSTVQVDSIPGSEDFVPKPVKVTLPKVPKNGQYSIVIDRDNKVKEIYEENNTVEMK
ncbi:MAG: LamG domain-containing protein [Candidatus Latescibacteria bacterium]|nr:LamG domain-containing protein [Candidatus Latescibacterota bacterium]